MKKLVASALRSIADRLDPAVGNRGGRPAETVSPGMIFALARAKTRLGGSVGLARALEGITSQAVSQWERVPVTRVLEVERVSGVSRYQLRPDIYGEAPAGAEAMT